MSRSAEALFKTACRIRTDFIIARYLMSNAHGRWNGAEKAQRHAELCAFYVACAFDLADESDVRRDHEDEFQAVHEATQALTSNLDEEIGFPLDSQPDYDALIPLFFERFHAIAIKTLGY